MGLGSDSYWHFVMRIDSIIGVVGFLVTMFVEVVRGLVLI